MRDSLCVRALKQRSKHKECTNEHGTRESQRNNVADVIKTPVHYQRWISLSLLQILMLVNSLTGIPLLL